MDNLTGNANLFLAVCRCAADGASPARAAHNCRTGRSNEPDSAPGRRPGRLERTLIGREGGSHRPTRGTPSSQWIFTGGLPAAGRHLHYPSPHLRRLFAWVAEIESCRDRSDSPGRQPLRHSLRFGPSAFSAPRFAGGSPAFALDAERVFGEVRLYIEPDGNRQPGEPVSSDRCRAST